MIRSLIVRSIYMRKARFSEICISHEMYFFSAISLQLSSTEKFTHVYMNCVCVCVCGVCVCACGVCVCVCGVCVCACVYVWCVRVCVCTCVCVCV